MSHTDVVVRLRGLTLHFDLPGRRVTLSPRAAPPGTPEGDYRAVLLSFDDLEALLTARFMSARPAEAEVKHLRGIVEGLADRVAAQSDLLSARALKGAPP